MQKSVNSFIFSDEAYFELILHQLYQTKQYLLAKNSKTLLLLALENTILTRWKKSEK